MSTILVLADAKKTVLIQQCLDGMTVCSAVEAWEAVEALATQSIDAVVIDLDCMPEEGWRIVENILDEGDNVAVILLSGDTNARLLRNATQLGVSAVVKHSHLNNLRARVRAALKLLGDHR